MRNYLPSTLCCCLIGFYCREDCRLFHSWRGTFYLMMTNDEAKEVCAAYGTAEVDDVTFKKCATCKSARYGSDECERDQRQQHEGACEKRAAELRDEILFKQPESCCFGDCPICFLPLPLDPQKSAFMTCCSKIICGGCSYAHALRNGLKRTCPFCRHPVPKSQAESKLNITKIIKKTIQLR